MGQTKCKAPAFAALAAAVAGAAVAALAPRAGAASSFTNVADTTTTAPGHGAFVGFGPPSLSGGNLAFIAGYGGSGIYTGTVGATGVAKVVENGDTAPPGPGVFDSLGTAPSISGSNVAFFGSYSGGFFGLYTGSVGAAGAAKVVDETTLAPGHTAFFIGFTNPSVSGSNIAFYGQYNDGPNNGSGIYTGVVGVTRAAKVVDTRDTASGRGAFTDFGRPALSGSNLAFTGSYGGGSGLYTGVVGATGTEKVADTGDTAPGHGAFTGFSAPSVSGSKVAFDGSYAGGGGIYTGTVGATGAAKVVDFTDTAPGHGAFTGFGSTPSVSGGNVAFVVSYSGGSGLYVEIGGAGGILTPLLNTGDALFGSTVTSFSLGSTGYDNNTLAFTYALADGRSGIAATSVPEPASLCLLAAGAGMMLRRRKA